MPSLTTYKLLKQEHDARRGEFKTVHGTVQTPAFQNVATAGAIKGGLSAHDLKEIGAQVMLCNTYHLHLRPGDKVVADMGGLHKFTRWNGPILTDSGGFQVFSLSKLRKITRLSPRGINGRSISATCGTTAITAPTARATSAPFRCSATRCSSGRACPPPCTRS